MKITSSAVSLAGVALLIFALEASAKLSTPYEEWREGPVQWLFTSEESKAWKALGTDEEASRFIDLFWVRRDPSLGTPLNEYHAEFDSRVAFADRVFAEKKRRGAMTDRGRVYIVLGEATNMANQLGGSTTQMGGTGGDPTGGRAMGQRFSWIWDHDDALKFDMPKIEVVFVEDPVTRKIQRDPQRGDFTRASQVALKKAVVNPELTEVPQWAIHGGLEPRVVMALPSAPSRPVAVETAEEEAPAEPAATVAPAAGSLEAGASRLVLLKDARVIAPNAASDPFASLSSVKTFSAKDSVGWALQYCSAAGAPSLKYLVHIAGPFEGDSSERVSKEKEIKGTPLKALPGCYLLRGEAPLSKLPAGTYELGILLDDASTGESYHPTQMFVIQ